MTTPPLRICVTGPECTGKTTLARRLAESIGTVWVPEAARRYAERVGRPLTGADVEPIGREHVALADEAAEAAAARGAPAIVLDTDLLSTVVYSRYYYDMVPPWVEQTERTRRADLYLLCDVDVPWLADGVRDQPLNRGAMFARFHLALIARAAELVIVRGDWDTRWALASAALRERLTGAGRTV